MTDDLRRTAEESQRERVHRLASLGGLAVLAGLEDFRRIFCSEHSSK
jgi:hypothetical protein